MEIRALCTGTVRIKTAMARGRGPTPLRQLRMLRGEDFTGELPIHAWLIEHADGPLLVDTGELASTRDLPIARFTVAREQEIDGELARVGVSPGDLSAVVLTHVHGDHANGLARLGGTRVLASAAAIRSGRRILRRAGARPQALVPERAPFGGFGRTAPITADGSVLAVSLPGHAPGHVGVLVTGDREHVLIAGDAAYSQEQLLGRWPDGVGLSRRLQLASHEAVLAHARRHPTVFLPAHDPGSAGRLAARTPLPVGEEATAISSAQAQVPAPAPAQASRAVGARR
jgi:glyoxylase-like metal-dependent hydrolase (beta-lactamase superfamily II)